MSIPVIDLSNPNISALAKEVKDACVSWGFMYLKNHGIKKSLIDRTFELSQEFFDETPLEVKKAFPRGLDHGSIGYTGQFTERLDVAKQVRGDLKETYNMGKFADLDYKHNEPETITKRREELLAFQKECYQVELKVLVLFALALDLPYDYFSRFHTAKEDIFRFTKYTPPDFPLVETDMGAGAHSDFGSLTLLFQDDVGGLQVLSKGEWVDATPIPDTILLGRHETCLIIRVNVADAMQFWTSDTLKSTKHRVLIPKKTRYSLVYFVVADPETPLKPIYATESGNVITAKEHLQWQIDIVMGFIPPPTGDLKVKAAA